MTRLSHTKLLRYASGNLGKSALSSMMEIYALFYCTEVLGIPPSIAGGIILLSLVWDALVDPLVGFWADRQLTRRPSLARLLMLGLPITTLSFLVFFNLDFVSSSLQLALVVPSLIIFRAAYTLVDIPHNSLMVLAVHDSGDRKRLASYRILFSAVGKFALTICATWFFAHGSISASTALSATATVMALLFVSAMGYCATSVKNVKIPAKAESAKWMPIAALRTLFINAPQLRLAFLLTAINSATIPTIGVVLIYSGKYHFNNTELGAFALMIQSAVQALLPLLWANISRNIQNINKLLAYAYFGLFMTCLIIGLRPMTETSLMALAALSGGFIAGIFMLNWVYFSDALAEVRNVKKVEATLSIFGLYSIVNKIAHGIAQAISGLALAMAVKGFAYQSPPLLSGVSLHFVLLAVAASGGLCCLVILIQRIRFETENSQIS